MRHLLWLACLLGCGEVLNSGPDAGSGSGDSGGGGGADAATSDAETVGSDAAVPAQPITVTGTVRGGRSGVTVRIVGKPAVISNAQGGFTFTGVTPPYDIYTVSTGFNSMPVVTYYEKLTRPDPVVDAASSTLVLSTQSTGTVSGSKAGSGDFVSPMVIAWSDGGSLQTTGSSWNFTARWSPAASTNDGTLYGLQFKTGSNGAPAAFLGFGQSKMTLTAGSTTFSANINFLPVATTAALTGSIKAPSGFPTPTLTLSQQFGTSAHPMWTASTTQVSARIPIIAAGTSAVHATSSIGGATVSFVHPALDADTNVSFDLPAPAVQVAPFSGATAITTSSPFEIVGAPSTIHAFHISTSGTAKATYQVFTTATTTKIPNVPELPLPPAQTFSWSVTGFGPATSIDAAAATSALELVSSTDFVGPRHFATSSPARTFTSQ